MSNIRRAVSAAKSHWSDNQKLEAVQTFLLTGSVSLAAAMTKVPETTLRYWMKLSWWKEIVEDLKTQDELQVSARLKKIFNNGLDLVEDRMLHGDFVYNQKTGGLIRKPINARDAHRIAIDSEKQRDAILGRQLPQASNEQIEDKLNKLAQKFADIVNGKKFNTGEIVDVEIKDTEGEVVYPESLSDEIHPDGGSENSEGFLPEEENSLPSN